MEPWPLAATRSARAGKTATEDHGQAQERTGRRGFSLGRRRRSWRKLLCAHLRRLLLPAVAAKTLRLRSARLVSVAVSVGGDGSLRARGGPEASFAQAVSRTGKPYSKLATAFAFQKKAVDACTCRAPGAAPLTVVQDPTLQPGDIVVTNKGVRVFRGAKKLPYPDVAFVDYRQDKEVAKKHRALLDFIDRRYRSAQAQTPAKQGDSTPARKSSANTNRNQQQARSPAPRDTHQNEALLAYAGAGKKSLTA